MEIRSGSSGFIRRLLSKRRSLRIGDFQYLSLSDARSEVIRFNQMLAEGIDPIDERQSHQFKIQQQAEEKFQFDNRINFSQLYHEFVVFCTSSFGGSQPRWMPYTQQKHDEHFSNHVLPVVGAMAVEDITKEHITSILLAIQERGTLSIRDKVKQVLSAVFQYGFDKKILSKRCYEILACIDFCKTGSEAF